MDVIDNGEDCQVALVDGWLWRGPRRPEIAGRLRLEAMLLPWLAPQLPLAVPQPEIRTEDPLRIRHRVIPGAACPGASTEHGRAVGSFLTALHAIDTDDATDHGARDATTCDEERAAHHDRFASEVVRLLPAHIRGDALALLMRLVSAAHPHALIHGDLGPDHVRVDGALVGGVIDWLDAGVHDPALDLAWPLHGTSPDFSAAVRDTYALTDDLEARARDLWLRAPWYAITAGLDAGDQARIDAGVDAFVRRLRQVA